MVKIPELMSPCADWVSLKAAIEAGADAVYFGVKTLNMRAAAKNFDSEELETIARYCHDNGAKAYLTVNIIIYNDEIEEMKSLVKQARAAGIDAIICWDMAVIGACRDEGIDFMISTQASVSNYKSAEFFRELGAKRIVLARECTLEEIKEIKNAVDIEIEAFVHGAMCVSVSGRCFMSQHLFNKSANRGECLQPCRRKYIIKDPEEDHELELGESYVMSPKDLCTLQFIDKLIEAGIDAFKIEGRARSPEYVKTVTEAYREAVDSYFSGSLDQELKEKLISRCKTVYNRGFSNGFFLDRPISDWTDTYGSKATTQKEYLGKVANYYQKIKVAEIYLEAGNISLGERIMFQGPTTGVYEQEIKSMEVNHLPVMNANKGQSVAVEVEEVVRSSDKVFAIRKKEKSPE